MLQKNHQRQKTPGQRQREIQPWLASTLGEVAHRAVKQCHLPETCTKEQHHGIDIDTILIHSTLMAMYSLGSSVLSEAGTAFPSVRVWQVHSPEPAHQEVLQAVDVIDGPPEPAVLVARMQVIHAHEHRGPACRLPALRSAGEVLVVRGRQARPGNVGRCIGQLRPAMQADLGGCLRSRFGAVLAPSMPGLAHPLLLHAEGAEGDEWPQSVLMPDISISICTPWRICARMERTITDHPALLYLECLMYLCI